MLMMAMITAKSEMRDRTFAGKKLADLKPLRYLMQEKPSQVLLDHKGLDIRCTSR